MGNTGDHGREQADRGGSAPDTHLRATRPQATDCADVLRLTGPLLDAELDEARVRHIQAHLAGCPACRLQVARARALEARIARSLTAGDCDQDRRWQRALERALPATPPAAGRPPRRTAFPSAVRWFALAASLLFLAALASAGLGLRHRHPWVPQELRGPGHSGSCAAQPRAAQAPPGADHPLPASPTDLDWTVSHDRSPA